MVRTAANSALKAGVCLAFMVLAACSASDGSEAPPPPPPPPPPAEPSVVALSASTDREVAAVDSPFVLTADVFESNASVDAVEWTLPDGSLLFGEQTEVRFDAAGVYTVRANAFDDGEDVAQDTLTLVVVESGDPTPAYTGLPDVFGDADGSGGLDLSDVLRAAQIGGGLSTELDDQPLLALNVDFSPDGVTPADAALLARALAAGAALPEGLLESSGAPGAVLTIVSPSLLDLTGPPASVRVDGVESPFVSRSVGGYLAFMVPEFTLTAPRQAEVSLLIDGAEAARFEMELLPAEPLPADPAQAVLDALDAAADAAEDEGAAFATFLEENDGAASDAGVFPSFGALLAADLRAFRDDISEFADDPDTADMFELMLVLMNGAGLQDALDADAPDASTPQAAIASLSAITPQNADDPDFVCKTLLPAGCDLKAVAEKTRTLRKAVKGVCFLNNLFNRGGSGSNGAASPQAFKIALIPGAAAGAGKIAARLGIFLRVQAFCFNYRKQIRFANTVTGLGDKLGFQIFARPTSVRGRPGDDLEFQTGLRVQGANNFCSRYSEILTDAYEFLGRTEQLSDLVRDGASPANDPDLPDDLEKDLEQNLSEVLEELGDGEVTAREIINAVRAFADAFCGLAQRDLPYPADEIFSQPPQGGTLSFDGERATYRCPPRDSTEPLNITLAGSEQVCKQTQSLEVTLECATTQVVITWGDDGPALDDIFELRIPALNYSRAPGTPVRDISEAFDLPSGEVYEAFLEGRAAPDGAGTYFINFSGATVISGDSQRGGDLTPGRRKTYVFEVE